MKRLYVSAICIASLIGIPSLSVANAPGSDVTLLVPVANGSASYRQAQQVAIALSAALERKVGLESVVGENGRLAIERLLKAAPDGRTLLLANGRTVALIPRVQRSFKFDASKDVAPVARLYNVPMTVVVRQDSPFGDTAALAAAKQLKVQSGPPTSDSYICALSMKQGLGPGTDVASQPGSGPALGELLAGRGDLLCDTMALLKPYLINGQIRELQQKAEAIAPKPLISWSAVFAPSGTPVAVIEDLVSALRSMRQDIGFRASVEGFGGALVEDVDASPESLKRALTEEQVTFGPLIEAAGKYLD